MTKPIAVALILAGIAFASEAEAQYVIRRGQALPAAVSRPSYSSPMATGLGSTSYSSYYSGPATPSQPARTYSYSYYSLSPLPARTYVGYGMADFPFQGVPYGHPYDPWTWPTMSGSYGNGLARYYDPPVK